jgi:hypothetical protein
MGPKIVGQQLIEVPGIWVPVPVSKTHMYCTGTPRTQKVKNTVNTYICKFKFSHTGSRYSGNSLPLPSLIKRCTGNEKRLERLCVILLEISK